MKSLLDHGFSVAAGVINVLDSDYQNAEDLHISTVAEAPFAPIGEEAHTENLRMVQGSSSVVVSPFPVGPGNLKNLDAAKAALVSGKEVFILPAADAMEKEGSIVTSGRLIQWRPKVAEAPGEALPDHQVFNLVALKLKELYGAEPGLFAEPILNLNWD